MRHCRPGPLVAEERRLRVVLATRNAHKVAELNRILADAGFAGELVGLEAFPDAPDVPETGSTFADNALLKARAIAVYTGLPAVSDDSGLTVNALNGMPGILSARWAGKHGDDHANLELVLGQLADIDSRGAAFVASRRWRSPTTPGNGRPRVCFPGRSPERRAARTASATNRSSSPTAWKRRPRSWLRKTRTRSATAVARSAPSRCSSPRTPPNGTS